MNKTIDQGKDEIAKLCQYFANNRQAFLAPGVKEAHIRQSLIDPFFEALGWDMRNAAMAAPQYREVITEDSLDIEGQQKAPDYTFRVGTLAKFYVEAKKCGVNINIDMGPAYQLRRYGFSARLALSILTDFEELGVYDCASRPRPNDKASHGRVQYFGFAEYPDRWQEIWNVFSREAVWSGTFDQYAASKRKRGTSEVDSEFLKDIEGWRDVLARNLALRNSDLSADDLNAVVQRIIDRIIFLRMAEDRGLESYGQLHKLCEQPDIYDRFMSGLCRKADQKYNSGLFHFQKEPGVADAPDTLTPRLVVDDNALKPILQSLYFEHGCPYHFGVLPVEILGTVYERFLGKVIRLTAGHQAKVEEKPEVRKAGGVYYTPQYIVEYIVKNTVGKLLENCQTPADAVKLKILDPACGSGSFLVGAYAALIDWHIKYFDTKKQLSAADRAEAYYDSDGRVRLTARLKRQILINNLFGVDIDQQAVEVTRFSLSLKALEDTRREELYEERSLFKETVLPDLNQNIKCGNSLIGPDYFSGKMFPDSEELRRVNPFDWQREFPAIFSSGGFDAVIGNPPYGAQFSDEIKKYFRTNFVSSQGRYESYWYFIEKGLTLTGVDGRFCLIVPDTWFTLRDAESLRRLILSEANIEKLLVLHENVFEKVKVDVCIFVASKILKRELTTVFIASKDHTLEDFVAERFIKEFKVDQSKWLSTDESRIIVNQSQDDVNLISKISINSVFLSEISIATTGPKPYQIGKGVPPQTKQIIETKPFTSDHKKNKTFRIMLRGSDIARYSYPLKSDEYLSYGEWLAEIRDPTIFDRPRLLVQSIRNPKLKRRIIATYTKDDFINNNSITNIVVRENAPYDIFYLLGILNSNLINWLFVKSFNIVNIDPRYLKMVPICRIDCSNPNEKSLHNKMIVLVESILLLHKHMAEAKTRNEQELIQRQIDAIDREIDRIVYELYKLTEDEMRIVEGVE